MSGFTMAGELLSVIVRDRVDVVAERGETMHGRAMSGRGCRTGQFRDGGEQAFALDIGEQRPFVVCAHDGVPFPIAQP